MNCYAVSSKPYEIIEIEIEIEHQKIANNSLIIRNIGTKVYIFEISLKFCVDRYIIHIDLSNFKI